MGKKLLFLVFIFSAFEHSLCGQNKIKSYRFNTFTDIANPVICIPTFGISIFMQANARKPSTIEIQNLIRKNINSFDRIATYQWNPKIAKASDIVAGASALLPFALLLDKNMRRDGLKIANVTFQSFLLSQTLCNVAKLSLRKRPYVYNTNLSLETRMEGDNNLSFFSGHTTAVSSLCFSTAFAYNTYHPNSNVKPYILVGAFTLPAIQGLLRVKAGKHYPTDVITGYLVGLGTSFLMHKLHVSK